MVFTLTTGNKLNNTVHLVGLSDSGKRTKMKNPLAVALNTVREIQLALVHDAEQVAKGRGIQHEVRHLLVRSLAQAPTFGLQDQLLLVNPEVGGDVFGGLVI